MCPAKIVIDLFKDPVYPAFRDSLTNPHRSVGIFISILTKFKQKGGIPMVRFIPYEKLPKKKQQELDRQKRGSWNGVNPVTRKPEDSKVYNRQKAQSWKKDNSDALLFIEREKSGVFRKISDCRIRFFTGP